jgi:hypothetical protein
MPAICNLAVRTYTKPAGLETTPAPHSRYALRFSRLLAIEAHVADGPKAGT